MKTDEASIQPLSRRPWRARLQSGASTVLAWTPVWVPLVFLMQLLLLGYLPARAEAARLDRAEHEVRSRTDALLGEERTLQRQARMLEDPIYQERVRRSLLDPTARPLTLEHARPDTEQ